MSAPGPHSILSDHLASTLGKDWLIRTGDRPLDGLANKPTVVVYTSSLSPSGSVTAVGYWTSSMSLVVIPPESSPDATEAALFEALAPVLLSLDLAAETFTVNRAERVIYQDRPAFQLDVTLTFHLTKE